MGAGWKIGRVAGIELAIHPSWLVIAFLVTYSLAAFQFPRDFPGWTTAQYWLVGGGTAALFFASVLAHELSHAVLARRFGMVVKGITLFIFGGATELDDEARRPRDEALIALAGPATSLIIGGGLLAVQQLVGQEQIAALLSWLGVINILLGVFNLIPGFPMDGGRVLRAVLWRFRGDRLLATRNAASVGRLFAYLLIGFGVFLALQPGGRGLFSGIWLALIGWFLSNAASATETQAGVERSLRGVRVRDVMESEPPSVSPNETVGDLIQDRLLRGSHRSFLVRHDDGGLAGIVTLGDVQRVPREEWAAARVTDVMTRFADLATVSPEDSVTDALKLLQQREVAQLPVVVEGRDPVGLLTRGGILRLIEARMKLGV
ncbi:MAG: site-2 protease family protein [Candidatus Limnocylindria bacterium]